MKKCEKNESEKRDEFRNSFFVSLKKKLKTGRNRSLGKY